MKGSGHRPRGYADGQEEGAFFEQLLLDGFVARLWLRRREVIGDADLSGQAIAHGLEATASRIVATGGWSLFHEDGSQWANGVCPSGDEFIPLFGACHPMGLLDKLP